MYSDKNPYKDRKQSEYAEEINQQEFTQNIHKAKVKKGKDKMDNHPKNRPDEQSESAIDQSDHYLPNLKRPPRIENDCNLITANDSSHAEADYEYGQGSNNDSKHQNANNDEGRNEKIRSGHSFNYQTASDKQLIFSNYFNVSIWLIF